MSVKSTICLLQAATLLIVSPMLHAQLNKIRSLQITYAGTPVVVDGKLDDAVWGKAEKAKEFIQTYPYDTGYAETRTEVMMAYDDAGIYVAAICYDDLPDKSYVIQSLKRDFSFPVSDAFAVFIDPFNDHQNGFSFSVNPLGVQREGLVEGGGGFGVTTSWDNKWFSAVTNEKDKWVVEMAIPFKTIRYKEGVTTWGINFSRNDLKRNERSTWNWVPRTFNVASLAYTGELRWPESPKSAGANISIIPYAIGTVGFDYVNDTNNILAFQHNLEGKTPTDKILRSGTDIVNAGFDAKVALGPALNLDLTFNPDFSQVEVDAQQTNLTRYSLYYPEKRQFFIENSDLFAQFGFRQIRPFFSRRIGLYNGNRVPILGGARLSGKVNKKLRIGILNMQTAADSSIGLAMQNYSVATLQQQVFGLSYISAIFVNKQGFETDQSLSPNDYNRIAGLEYDLVTRENKWRGKAFYQQSFSATNNNNAYAHASWLMYNSTHLFAMWNHEYVGDNFNAEVGFVPHNKLYDPAIGAYVGQTYWRIEPMIKYIFYPQSGVVNHHGPQLYMNHYFDGDFKATDLFFMPHYNITFQNTSVLELHFHEMMTRLIYDSDVTNTGQTPLPADTYEYRNLMLRFDSDKRKRFNWKAKVSYGGFYNGQKFTVKGELNYRVQPWGIFSLKADENQVSLPDSFPDMNILLVGPKVELSFTRDLFFSTFVQYNTQIDNLNINARLQWRFKPMSDLFVVYTDNYDSNLGIKNRAVVVKFIYWLSI